MSTFVLVHGAWGGAHTWRTVRPILWAAGHQVFTPALTGIGERAHVAHAEIGLNHHVDDVTQQILYEDLRDIVLVGFSYGGMVVTGVLDRLAERIRRVVFLDAFVPSPGQSAADLTGWDDLGSLGPGAPMFVPPRDRTFDDPAEAEFAAPRRTPQPARTLTEAVESMREVAEHDVELVYIKATGDPRHPGGPDPFWDAADRARTSDRWRYHEIDSNHMVPQNRPAELAALLLDDLADPAD